MPWRQLGSFSLNFEHFFVGSYSSCSSWGSEISPIYFASMYGIQECPCIFLCIQKVQMNCSLMTVYHIIAVSPDTIHYPSGNVPRYFPCFPLNEMRFLSGSCPLRLHIRLSFPLPLFFSISFSPVLSFHPAQPFLSWHCIQMNFYQFDVWLWISDSNFASINIHFKYSNQLAGFHTMWPWFSRVYTMEVAAVNTLHDLLFLFVTPKSTGK